MKMDLKLTALAAALLLAGCASDSNNTAATATPATNHAEAASEVATLKQQITQAEQRLAQAKTQELDWLATDLMQEATQALQDAKEYYVVIEKDPTQAHSSSGFFSSTTNWQAAEENLKAFNDAVNQAQALQRQAHTLLAEAFSYRSQLHQLKANDIYPSTYQRLDGEFKTLIEWIADNDAERATQAQPALVTKLRALEVKTVVHLYLDDAKKTLASLKKANISQHAPDTLAAAAAAVVAAEAFITADPRDMDTIKQKADDAVFALKHTRHIADAVQQLKLLPAKDYERYVVSQETILLNISQALGADDSRDRALPEQGQAIVATFSNISVIWQISSSCKPS
ncbi:ATPase [Photobacterium aphoticum]|uniref:ATPase n=1 Tax=Photobacterium aphoticum TaxID=754436 RepID=A0A090QRK2_9GAMM|nr:ATPase [Photobacterium aphoticum]